MPNHPEHHRTGPRKDDANAFLPDPDGGPIEANGDAGDEMTEDFLRAATSGQDEAEDVRNQELTEELGGPFVSTSAAQEIAYDTDESNPSDSEIEGLPSPMRGRP